MNTTHIRNIKGNGVAIIDKMRRSIAFTDKQRLRLEQIYQAIRSIK